MTVDAQTNFIRERQGMTIGGRSGGGMQAKVLIQHKRPSVTGGPRLSENLTEPAEKILPVRVIPVNTAALNPTADNMVQRSGGINAGSARHAGILPKPIQKLKH